MFQHKFFAFVDLPTIEINGQRHYKLPDGTLLKSVTTILSEYFDTKSKPEYIAWQKRLGEENAAKFTRQAANKGSAIHKMAEKYLINDPNYKKGEMPFNIQQFNGIKKILDEHVDIIYGLECPLYSKKLRTAGRTDLICSFDGIMTIGDFKGSTKPKKEEHILSYFVQTTVYALMFEELTGQPIDQIAIMVTVDHDFPQLFVKNKSDYLKKVKEIFG